MKSRTVTTVSTVLTVTKLHLENDLYNSINFEQYLQGPDSTKKTFPPHIFALSYLNYNLKFYVGVCIVISRPSVDCCVRL